MMPPFAGNMGDVTPGAAFAFAFAAVRPPSYGKSL